ncbi:MAG TPA: hypothetical protein VND65_13480 [Candidatus Binatia bacterium]|nr:hypothetical protein [Candidatus Binatia bacterium]
MCPGVEDVDQGATVYDGITYSGGTNPQNWALNALELDMAGAVGKAKLSTTSCYAFRRQ